MLHYFEVFPNKLNVSFLYRYSNYFYQKEFDEYGNNERDIQILNSTFNALSPFKEFIFNLDENSQRTFSKEIPSCKPVFLLTFNDNGISKTFDEEHSREVIEGVNYLML